MAGAAALALAAVLGGCQSAPAHDSKTAFQAHWTEYRHLAAVVDLTGPGPDGSLTVAAGGRLLRLSTSGALSPFAQGPGGYSTRLGGEPYVALVPGGRVPGAGCSFGAGSVFALRTRVGPGVVEVTSQGRARRFASLPGTFPDGITYDTGGRFGHRLLVTSAVNNRLTVFAFDCAGRSTTLAANLPQAEGGMVIAPRSFGSYGGDLIATNELTGQIWAITPGGRALLVARSGLPAGHDLGVESAGFIPPGFGAGWAAYVADRRVPGSPHPGTESILRLSGASLQRVGARPGDLIVAAEGGAVTILVRCAATCTVRRIADGPAVTHTEGHIVFAPQG